MTTTSSSKKRQVAGTRTRGDVVAMSGAKRPPGKPATRVGTSDQNLKTLRASLGLTQPQMSRAMGISTRKLSELESKDLAPKADTRRRATEIQRLHHGLTRIIDPDDIAPWMNEPNPAFEGSTPLQLIERGEIDRLWQMIYLVQSGQPR